MLSGNLNFLYCKIWLHKVSCVRKILEIEFTSDGSYFISVMCTCVVAMLFNFLFE